MIVRKATHADVSACAEIYKKAKQFMRECGNATQWLGEYPNEVDVIEDIKNGVGYVAEDEGEVVAVFAFIKGNEPTYDKIYDGAWLSDAPYGFVHRIAVGRHGRGVGEACLNFCFSEMPNIRIDTHENNKPMQRLLQKNGFTRCGIIYLENGDPRVAFQKI